MSEQDQNPAAPQQGATKGTFASKLADPSGRQTIDIGDGRSMRFFRSERFQQARIEFYAPEGEHPKPDAKYTQWLGDHDWTWRKEEKAWTKQLARNTEEQRFARANSDLTLHLEFIELANLIRHDKGMESVSQLDEPRRAVGG